LIPHEGRSHQQFAVQIVSHASNTYY
jgi:hypothetical protein